nr:MAG TPA: hypothetical protein [Bacteriophage sp.]
MLMPAFSASCDCVSFAMRRDCSSFVIRLSRQSLPALASEQTVQSPSARWQSAYFFRIVGLLLNDAPSLEPRFDVVSVFIIAILAGTGGNQLADQLKLLLCLGVVCVLKIVLCKRVASRGYQKLTIEFRDGVVNRVRCVPNAQGAIFNVAFVILGNVVDLLHNFSSLGFPSLYASTIRHYWRKFKRKKQKNKIFSKSRVRFGHGFSLSFQFIFERFDNELTLRNSSADGGIGDLLHHFFRDVSRESGIVLSAPPLFCPVLFLNCGIRHSIVIDLPVRRSLCPLTRHSAPPPDLF